MGGRSRNFVVLSIELGLVGAKSDLSRMVTAIDKHKISVKEYCNTARIAKSSEQVEVSN